MRRKRDVMNWGRIKKDYISDRSTSYRKLAEKYQVSLTTLKKIGAREHWAELRRQADAKQTSKIVDTVITENAKIDGKFYKAIDLLLEEACNYLSAPGQLRAGDIKDMSTALKNIKDIKGIKSELDLEEQRARISALKAKKTPEDNDDEGGGVVIIPAVDLQPEGGETDG